MLKNSPITDETIYGQLVQLVKDPNIQRMGLPSYSALDTGKSAVRVTSGATVKSAGQAMSMSDRFVSAHKDSVIVTLLNDSASRENGKYGVRSRTIASIKEGQNIPFVSVVRKRGGNGWEEISLEKDFIFPELNPLDEQEFYELLIHRALLENRREFIKKDRDNLKKKLVKGEICQSGRLAVWWEEPHGTDLYPSQLVDGEWVKVSQESYVTTNNVRLSVPTSFPVPFRHKDLSDLPYLFHMFEVLGYQIERLNRIIRPFELGIIERNKTQFYIDLHGERVKLDWYQVSGSDYPSETKEKLESGEWKLVEFQKKNGRWVSGKIWNVPPKVITVS